jgi:hypothetical protein
MNLPEDVRGDLKRLAGIQPLFTLLNYYKGVPITHAASLRHIDLNAATVNIHPHQAVCLHLEGRTRLQSKLMSLAIQAEASQVNLTTNTANLTGFKRVGYLTERRQFVRLEPNQRIEVEIAAQNWIVHGRLEDISAVSLSVYLPGEEIFFEPEIVFKEYAGLSARLRLPGNEPPLELAGLVTEGTPQPNHDYRVGVRLSPNAEAQKTIRDYIQYRQAEAAQELQTLYDQMRQEAK